MTLIRYDLIFPFFLLSLLFFSLLAYQLSFFLPTLYLKAFKHCLTTVSSTVFILLPSLCLYFTQLFDFETMIIYLNQFGNVSIFLHSWMICWNICLIIRKTIRKVILSQWLFFLLKLKLSHLLKIIFSYLFQVFYYFLNKF